MKNIPRWYCYLAGRLVVVMLAASIILYFVKFSGGLSTKGDDSGGKFLERLCGLGEFCGI